MPTLADLLRRRWWLIGAVVVLALAAAGAYGWRQQHVYESTATLYVHPSPMTMSHASPAVISSELSNLSYGSLVNTFLTIAQSRSMLVNAGSAADVPPGRLASYTTVATIRPKSLVFDVSVDGPDRRLVTALANRLAQVVSTTVTTEFPIVAASSLDAASASSLIRPRLKRDLVYGAVAGLILGFVLGLVSLSRWPTAVKLEHADQDGSHAGDGISAVETPKRHADANLGAAGPARSG
jgi:capsular polysaccharide biosynthesis protein